MTIKTDNLEQVLPLALQIIMARSTQWYGEWLRTRNYSDYAAFGAYDAAASLICEALAGNYDVIRQWDYDESLMPEIDLHDDPDPCSVCPDHPACALAGACAKWQAWDARWKERSWTEWHTRVSAAARERMGEKAREEHWASTEPCVTCPDHLCELEADGKGACGAYVAWKAGK